VHFATRVQISRVVHVSSSSCFFISIINADEKFASCIHLSLGNFDFHPAPQTKIERIYLCLEMHVVSNVMNCKGQAVHVHALKTWSSGGVAPLILYVGMRCR
jgi:hypothetical protein